MRRGRLGSPADDANRVTYDDDVFLRTHRVLGLEVTSQMVWRFDAAPSAGQVETLHARLAAGPLSRLAQRGRLPLERATWRPTDVVEPVRYDGVLETESADGGSTAEERMAWVAEVARGLDPEHGPPWRLAWVVLPDGGALVSLAVSHAVADGAAMAQAVVAAVEGVALGQVPDPGACDGVVRRQPGGAVASPAHELLPQAARGMSRDISASVREVVGRLGAIASGASMMTRRASALLAPGSASSGRDAHANTQHESVRASSTGEPPVEEPVIDVTRPARVVAFDIDRDAWREAAESRGGSENSLFLAVVTAVTAHGETRPDVVVPVSNRTPGDLRSNDSSGVRVSLTSPVSERDDLRQIRRDTGTALRGRRDGTNPDALAPWKPLIQALPDAVVRRLVGDAPGPRCLASSMGEAPASLVALFGTPAEAVLMNAVTHPASHAAGGASARHHLGGAVSAWWSATPVTVTMTLAVTDDVIAPDVDALAQRVSDELSAWGLTSRRW